MEFVVASSRISFADIPDHGLRMAVHCEDSETHVRLASATGLWDQIGSPSLAALFRSPASQQLLPHLIFPGRRCHCSMPSMPSEFYLALNDTAAAYPADACVHELVMRQVEQTPNALAIASESQQFTYRQLHERSDAIARQLQALGAGPVVPLRFAWSVLPISLWLFSAFLKPDPVMYHWFRRNRANAC